MLGIHSRKWWRRVSPLNNITAFLFTTIMSDNKSDKEKRRHQQKLSGIAKIVIESLMIRSDVRQVMQKNLHIFLWSWLSNIYQMLHMCVPNPFFPIRDRCFPRSWGVQWARFDEFWVSFREGFLLFRRKHHDFEIPSSYFLECSNVHRYSFQAQQCCTKNSFSHRDFPNPYDLRW